MSVTHTEKEVFKQKDWKQPSKIVPVVTKEYISKKMYGKIGRLRSKKSNYPFSFWGNRPK